MAVDTAREEKALLELTNRLVEAYGDEHGADQVTAVVGAVRQRFDGHAIREFVPILVERIARRELTPEEAEQDTPQSNSDNASAISVGDKANSTAGNLLDTLTGDKRILGGLAAAVVLVLVVAVALAVRQPDSAPPAAAPATLTTIRGVVGSEKIGFFSDPKVIDTLAKHGVRAEVDPAGSRQIATSVDLGGYDFAFPSSTTAAERIQRQRTVSGKYTPFSSPMAIATFEPIAELLTAAGVVRPGPTPILDMAKYLELVEKGTQWDELAGNTSYPVRKHVLISTTDPRTSSSAAMYLAVAAYVANENSIVRGTAAEDHALSRVSRLFTRQGYTENSTDGPFQEYLAAGMGPAPLVWIYEAQYVDAAVQGRLKPDMMLMYPSPTVLSQHTVVPLNDNGDRIGKLLSTDAELQRLAAEHGFRPNDPALFAQVASRTEVPVTPDLIDVVDLPGYETLERLLDGVAKVYN
ncbi:three-helix bundle dimerization domain-containing protein [Nocardia sp. NPDC127526]|uniref:three-helix bundle dimerization domain-containing protein n=1 Tax=Nocardia sp. NPDC127526 TaxID=3345393 RepID=UPI00362938B9